MTKIFSKLGLLSYTIVILLSGCSAVKTPTIETYNLTIPTSLIQSQRSKTHLTLLVSRPQANPGFETDQMIYQLQPYQFKTFAKNRWIAPPSQMLLPIFVQRIRQHNYFFAVIQAPSAINTNFKLETQILSLQQQFFAPISQVKLVIQATLINALTGVVIASKQFQAVIDAPGNNPYSGVLSANQAAALVSEQIAQFTIRHAKPQYLTMGEIKPNKMTSSK